MKNTANLSESFHSDVSGHFLIVMKVDKTGKFSLPLPWQRGTFPFARAAVLAASFAGNHGVLGKRCFFFRVLIID
ncbi:MAG TPA: hypothetical protein PLR50_10810 [Candidatus Rifleibacterium sp.]|nr:hypothetical protein [Candidatus Rifleibacterium sp.]